MDVLVDATSLPPQRLGVARYLFDLLRELGACDAVRVHALVKHTDAPDVAAAAPGAVLHTARLRSRPLRLAWEQAVLPARVRRIGPDVLHGPHYTLPAAAGRPAVVTFHDPTFFTMPHVHERSKVAWFTRMARAGVRRAARVIAVSEYAKQGAVAHAGADPSLVDVVYEGVDHATYTPRPDDADPARRRAAGADGPYLFWVGAIEPRKGLATLVRAFAQAGAGHSLVLAGAPRWGAAQLDDAVRSSGAGGRIVRPGYVDEPTKVALYRGATALVYPSLAEGFGRQVLEAMACGCPVVTTTGSAPEEVGGDAVVTVAPGDADALAGAVASLVGDESSRAALASRGLVRAATFTAARMARETVAVYRKALGQGRAA